MIKLLFWLNSQEFVCLRDRTFLSLDHLSQSPQLTPFPCILTIVARDTKTIHLFPDTLHLNSFLDILLLHSGFKRSKGVTQARLWSETFSSVDWPVRHPSEKDLQWELDPSHQPATKLMLPFSLCGPRSEWDKLCGALATAPSITFIKRLGCGFNNLKWKLTTWPFRWYIIY